MQNSSEEFKEMYETQQKKFKRVPLKEIGNIINNREQNKSADRKSQQVVKRKSSKNMITHTLYDLIYNDIVQIKEKFLQNQFNSSLERKQQNLLEDASENDLFRFNIDDISLEKPDIAQIKS